MPIMPLPRASSAMMCSRDVNTTLPIATMPSLLIASRMTANACWPTSPSGNVVRVVEVQLVNLLLRHELVNLDGALAFNRNRLQLFGIKLKVLTLADFVSLDDFR